ncbi:DUF3313 domain-containing protein [Sinorhizobium fredii]|uniref:DUF3313 domain-containing protein n=1 Tax=Sinorhizobium fredii (strain HH103) TaxID=1117943 RepID=G9A5U5_SINF1|nr:DUF3313 domain-containing protein [Sinorhizobium fredii]MCG5474386.1 DUF3313 family protein [Sinorhizobium fredii]MQW93774.1 DUF3313 family protein [Sinorhizobium fredii]UTY49177.1 DUF3313 domain-containing protein [Sinorhizobium fredii]CCE95773.1 conserved hypothetical protein [Sinorhizobium fredii HH103]
MLFSFQLPEIRPQAVLCVFLLLTVSSCANVPLHQGATLGSYAGMTASGGTLTKAKLRVDPAPVLAAQTVRIVPTSAQIGSGTAFDPKDLALVTNTIDRALCTGLSDRFKVVAPNQPADLVVRATVTDIVATNRAAAATSTVASLGVAAMLPVPVPRLPIGLGGLSVEAEAVGQDGSQKAAMVWSRGANMLTTRARMSTIGDAYSLSSAFGTDFSRMLVTGRDPFKGMMAMPSMQKMKTSLGGDPKYDACRAFGSAPGIKGVVAGQFGLPPGWTDKGASAPK